ncbi:IclR family transcriptional regulator [Uniformispora flossi]|uniref:IclR family transcriptional regulator n=1 Tax=Uniformispora flossi TaxID=3390723 RepID=UPI003C2C59BA
MTDRQSPSADRVVRILTLLTDHPGERLTLTQIAERLEMSKPTCLGVLASLSSAGLLTRDDAKTYGPGPALLRMGTAAESSVAPLDLIRPHLEALHREAGSCMLVANIDAHVVVLDRRGVLATGDTRDFVGERFPAAAPLGLVNNLWNPDADLHAWLARTPLVPLAGSPDRVFALAADARQRGYVVECEAGPDDIGHAVIAQLVSSHLPQAVLRKLFRHLPPLTFTEYELPGEEVPNAVVRHMTAPIFDHHGRQPYVFTVVVDGTPDPDTRRRIADTLVATTTAATKALGGVNPWTA